MRNFGFSRPVTLLLLTLGGIMLLSLLGAAALLITSTPLFGRAPVLGTPVSWERLPTPRIIHPQWTSYSYAGRIHDLVQRDNLLWAATDGGVVAWDLRGEESVKFMVEHGVAANRAGSIDVGLDGRIWVGTSAGVSRYDGTTWERFTTADGLVANTVTDLRVDRDGIVWVGTLAGLSRYDGRSWRSYQGDGLLNALPAEEARALALTPDNRLWLATERGVVVGTGNGRGWQTYTVADGLLSENVTALAVNAGGTVWAGSDLGLNRFDGVQWQSFPLPDQMAGRAIEVIAPASDGNVWIGFGATGKGVAHFDGTRIAPATFTLAGDLASANVFAIRPAPQGTWFGTAQGAHFYNGRSWQALPAPSELPTNQINTLLEADGAVWAATEAGIGRFDGAWHLSTTADGLASDAVHGLATDNDGAVWAAYASPLQGLSRHLSGGTWSLTTCSVNAPPSSQINAGGLAPDGSVWFATQNGVAHFDGARWRHMGPRDGLPSSAAHALQIDPQGRIWVGTNAGLARYEEAQWITLTTKPVDQIAIAPGGAVWVVSEGRAARLQSDGALAGAPPPGDSLLRAIATTDAALWAATPDGVGRYADGAWRFFTTDDGLPSNDVTAVAVDANERVWVASSLGGQEIDFAFFDGERWRPHPNREVAAEKLIYNVVTDIETTPFGIWFGTASGLSQLRSERWTSYSDDIFPLPPEVRDLAYAYGHLWVGSDQGLAMYDGSVWTVLGSMATAGGVHGPVAMGVDTLAVAPDGALWVASDNFSGGLRVYDGLNWGVVGTLRGQSRLAAMTFDSQGRLWAAGERLDTPELFLGYYDPQAEGWVWQLPGTQPFPISVMEFDPDGRLWLGAANGQGLVVYDVAPEGTLREIVASFGAPSSPTALTFGPNGSAWAASDGQLFSWNGRSWTEVEVPLAFVQQIYAIKEDETGALWLATDQGTAHRQDGTWQTYYAPPVTPAWWGSVRSLQVREDSALLLGTAVGGVGLYTGRGFQSGRPPDWSGRTLPVTTIFNDADNHLWIGTEGGGVARLDGLRWDVFAPSSALTAPLRGLGFTPDGTAWLGTERGLVAITDLDESRCTIASIQAEVTAVTAHAAADGSLWFGTDGQGAVHQYGLDRDPEVSWPGAPITVLTDAPNGEMWFVNTRQDWLSYGSASGTRRIPLDRGQITAAEVTALAITSNRDVWLGSPRGALRFNGREWDALTTADGLADNQVMHLLSSTDGSLWFSTPGGLSQYRP